MRFLQFVLNSKRRVGVLLTAKSKEIIDINSVDEKLPNTLVALLNCKENLFKVIENVAGQKKHQIPLEAVKVISPITEPGKIVAVGLNYKDHCEELGLPIPKIPVIFNKFSTSIAGPFDDIIYPEQTKALDFEVELGIVIGKHCKNLKEEEAYDNVFGYTVVNDISARDWFSPDINSGQWIIGKSFDTFCPLGPVVVTSDGIRDPQNLNISLSVNGLKRQDSNTNKMVFKVNTIISYLSRLFTLYPGDLILTGTPPGVGYCAKPPNMLQKGDLVECEIENIGRIANRVK